jgi:AAA+ superfamily predicted ATPase
MDSTRIADYVRAGFAGLYLLTQEEVRAEAGIKAVAEELGYKLFAWTTITGTVDVSTGSVSGSIDPVEAVSAVSELPEKSILLLKDFHQFLGDSGQPANPMITRILKEKVRECRCSGKVLLLLGCSLRLPPEIAKDFTVIEYGLPDEPFLSGIADSIAKSAGIELSSDLVQSAAEAARGLTATEAEDIFALSVVRTQQLESGLISSEKARAIAKDGILELSESKETLDSIGGLGELKSWTLRRRNAFSPRAREYGLPVPKGVLILGIPGTGKSLCAKASASAFGFPLLKLDAGKLFAGIVGESEANLRRAIQTAEAIAPAILWIDEIEKGFSGSRSSGSTDGGTSARVFGSFISWMQEKEAPVFVVATANDISQLPPELLRKGRFDELFFVDLPDEVERRRIWEIHISRRERDPRSFDLQSLSDLSKGFTGSEIEQVVVDALFESFDRDSELTDEALTDAVIRTVPLSTTMAESIRALRDWAKNRARPASIPSIGSPGIRQIAA